MVFAYYGIRESEGNLVKELKPNEKDGTSHEKMIDAVLKRGLHCYVNNDATLEEVDSLVSQDIPVIVHFLETSEQEDHYSVVVGISEKEIVLNDPWNGERLHLLRKKFEERWTCNTVGGCKQWLMAVAKEPLLLGKQYHPHE